MFIFTIIHTKNYNIVTMHDTTAAHIINTGQYLEYDIVLQLFYITLLLCKLIMLIWIIFTILHTTKYYIVSIDDTTAVHIINTDHYVELKV